MYSAADRTTEQLRGAAVRIADHIHSLMRNVMPAGTRPAGLTEPAVVRCVVYPAGGSRDSWRVCLRSNSLLRRSTIRCRRAS